MDFKSFTLKELRDANKWANGCNIVNENSDIKLNDKLTIGDYIDLRAYKGHENYYLNLVVYKVDPSEQKAHDLMIYTKEAHQEMKELIKNIISQS